MSKEKGKRQLQKFIIPITIALLIKIFSLFPNLVESWYSTALYKWLSILLRTITGFIPFSIGDILYILAGIWLLLKLMKAIIALFKKKVSWQSFLTGLKKTILVLLWVYIIFNLFWGLNYDRMGIAYQLQLSPAAYSTNELKSLTDELEQKLNDARKVLGDSDVKYNEPTQVFQQVKQAYIEAEKKYSFLDYKMPAIKKSIFGVAGNYMGYLGYYNPFTGEAQVNATIPSFLLPYTCCHEVAHQLGYGTEDEANFVAFLTAKNSLEKTFQYSMYFDLFNYANGELFMRDSLAARANYKSLDTLVRKDIQEYRTFLKAYTNPLEPVINVLYGQYLKANNQPMGLDTYDEVVAWLIAYRKKYGEL